MDDPGPFCELPASLLQELTKAVYEHRAGLKHLLHLVIHPQTTSYEINPHGSSFVAMRLLGERKVIPTARIKKLFPKQTIMKDGKFCDHKIPAIPFPSILPGINEKVNSILIVISRCASTLKHVTIRDNTNMPSNHFANFFKNLKTLTHIDIQGSLVDDVGFDGKNIFASHCLPCFIASSLRSHRNQWGPISESKSL